MESMKHSYPSPKKGNLPFSLHNYVFTSILNHGGSAVVYLCENITFSNQKYAAKVITVDSTDTNECWRAFDAEVKSLTLLDHPNIIRMYDHFREKNKFFMILDYCSGGSLHDEICRCNGLSFPTFQVLAREITEALLYCHQKGIAHRDIKAQNILLDVSGHAHLADFGLSLRTVKGQMYLSDGGSFEFTSPEIFMKKLHDPFAGDAWALGVVFAMMASGSSPWEYESLGDLKIIASQAQIRYKKPIPDVIDDLIRKLIVINPADRLTMKQVLEHPALKTQQISRNKFHTKNGHRNSFNSSAFSLLNWNSNRKNNATNISSNYSFGSEQENTAQSADSSIHSLSSAAYDNFQKIKDKQRQIKRKRHLTQPFAGIECVLEIE